MKALIFTIANPAKGDFIVVECCDPRGGRTAVDYTVIGAHLKPINDERGILVSVEQIPLETPHQIAGILANLINQPVGGWMPEAFEAKVSEKTGALVVNCTGLVQNVIFRCSVAGSGGTTIEMMEL
jgi:hypothetical protein